jgi:phosphoglycerate dehydrogenase-like enzyme
MSKTVLVFDKDAELYCEELRKACPAYAFRSAATVDEALAQAADAEILAALAPRIPNALVAAMPRLEWVHALTTGVDNLLAMPELRPDVIITNSRGMHGPQMSELAILLMMALARRLPAMLANQREAKWDRWPQPLLLGKTVCMVGLGVIAEELAARCKAFGMRVTGVSEGRSQIDGFARIYRRADLRAAAADADFLAVIVPYSRETHHLIDAGVLDAMKPSAFLINISRGGCVDEDALLAHLKAGRIAGAALDVFETEPLSADSPLWPQPNLIITPHVGGMADIYAQQALPIAIEHLNAYAEGGAAALPNRISRS